MRDNGNVFILFFIGYIERGIDLGWSLAVLHIHTHARASFNTFLPNFGSANSGKVSQVDIICLFGDLPSKSNHGLVYRPFFFLNQAC